jgi:nifR3 family TIM-barrel protein
MGLKIGDVALKNNIGLAPLAGYSNSPFRRLCLDNGCGFVISEMISSKGIFYQSKNTLALLQNLGEHPLGVQLFGADEESLVFAVRYICSRNLADFIDFNLGCPVPKVAVKTQAGSGLMKSPELAARLLKAMAGSSSRPITVKIRTGWSPETKNAPQIAKLAEQAGVAAIFIHGRSKLDGFSGEIDFQTIKDVKSAVGIPVFGNGDIKSYEDARNMMAQTGCDGVLIGRKAVENPWIFAQIDALKRGEEYRFPDLETKKNAVCRLLYGYSELFGDKKGVLFARAVAGKLFKMEKMERIVNNFAFQSKDFGQIIDFLKKL